MRLLPDGKALFVCVYVMVPRGFVGLYCLSVLLLSMLGKSSLLVTDEAFPLFVVMVVLSCCGDVFCSKQAFASLARSLDEEFRQDRREVKLSVPDKPGCLTVTSYFCADRNANVAGVSLANSQMSSSRFLWRVDPYRFTEVKSSHQQPGSAVPICGRVSGFRSFGTCFLVFLFRWSEPACLCTFQK